MGMAQWQRQRFSVLFNASKNEAVMIDTFYIRIRKMQKRLHAWASLVLKHREEVPCRLVMITLTYRAVDGWRAGHMNEFLRNLKQRLGKKLYAFAWVAELQKRGAVHYHVVLLTMKGARIPKPDKCSLWPHGMSKIETARSPFYLMTYTGKEYQKDLAKYPKGCWLYACSIRWGSEDDEALFRILAGLDVVGDADGVIADVGEGIVEIAPKTWDEKYIYVGSSVTESYAREILVPRGASIAERKKT